MNKHFEKILEKLEQLSSVEMSAIGAESIYILQIKGEITFDNFLVGTAKYFNFGELQDNKYQGAEVREAKVVLDRYGSIVGFLDYFYTFNDKQYLSIKNYKYYVKNQKKSRFQFTGYNYPSEPVVVDASTGEAMCVFELYPVDEFDTPEETPSEKILLSEHQTKEYEFAFLNMEEADNFKYQFRYAKIEDIVPNYEREMVN